VPQLGFAGVLVLERLGLDERMYSLRETGAEPKYVQCSMNRRARSRPTSVS
jgi:hypothetical protein